MTAGPYVTEETNCKKVFLCQGTEIGYQQVLLSSEQEFGGENRKLQNVVEKMRK